MTLLSKHGTPGAALTSLQYCNFPLDCTTCATLLMHFGNENAHSHGRILHNHIIECGHQQVLFISNVVLQMYGKCGCLDDCRALFAAMHDRNNFSWNFMIEACSSQGQYMEVLQLFGQMQLEGVEPDSYTFTNLVSACTSLGALVEGRQLHIALYNRGFQSDVVVGTALIHMYGRCSSAEEAQKVFDMLPDPNLVSWTAIITAYAQHNKCDIALQLFIRMQKAGIIPDVACFLSLFSACTTEEHLCEGSQVHDWIKFFKLEGDIKIDNALINMYGKCGSLEKAKNVFDKMLVRNVVTWTAMILIHAQQGSRKEALQLFKHMLMSGLMPNGVTLSFIFSVHANEMALNEGKQLHASIIGCQFEADVQVENALLNMYLRCGCLEDAWRVVNKMQLINEELCATLIAAHTNLSSGNDIFKFYAQMQQQGVILERSMFKRFLIVCAGLATLAQCKQMHVMILDCRHDLDIIFVNVLMNVYGRCGSWEDVHGVFYEMQEHNILSWNMFIGACVQCNRSNDAFRLLEQMKFQGEIPDRVTLISVLASISCPDSLGKVKQVHVSILANQLDYDIALGNCLINAYGKGGSPDTAWQAFEHLHEHDVISWSSLISAYVQNGKPEVASQLMDRMQLEGLIPDNIIFSHIIDVCTSLQAFEKGRKVHSSIVASGCELDAALGTNIMKMYGKCGNLDLAWWVFKRIHNPDQISWTAIIAVYAQNGQGKRVLQLFEEMLKIGTKPNSVTYVNILTACSHSGLIEEGCHIFASLLQDPSVIPVVEHYNCMIDLLSRAGLLREAQDMLKHMSFDSSHVSWMTLIGACKYHFSLKRLYSCPYIDPSVSTEPRDVDNFELVLKASFN